MKIAKRIAAIIVALAVFYVTAKLASFRCTGLSARFPDASYDVWFVWMLPFFYLLFVYGPIYDLLSLVTFKLGYDTSFDRTLGHPISIRQKVMFVYPFLAFVMAGLIARWAKIVYCG